jgi:hypothetical protein
MTKAAWRHTGGAAGAATAHDANPPHRPELAFRLGTARQFFDELLLRLHGVQADGPDGVTRMPFAGIGQHNETDWLAALLMSWSTVGDVLSFYQERLINEGYLRTARDPLSLELILAGSLGVRRGAFGLATSPSPAASGTAAVTVGLDPGCAATVDVLLSVSETRGMPRRVLLPAGSAVRVVSPSGAQAAYLETDQPVTLRREWNAMGAHLPPARRTSEMNGAAPGVRLDGVATSVKPGDRVLLTGIGRSNGAADGNLGQVALLRTVLSVLPLPAANATEITWVAEVADPPGIPTLLAPRVFRFRRRLGLFGADAAVLATLSRRRRLDQGVDAGGVGRLPVVSASVAATLPTSVAANVATTLPAPGLPAATAAATAAAPAAGPAAGPAGGAAAGANAGLAPGAWQRRDGGLPAGRFLCVLALTDGAICLGTDDGAYFSQPGDAAWTATKAGMTQRAVTALARGPGNTILAGTATGGVFRTEDPVGGWDSLAGGFVIDATGRKSIAAKAALPAEVVRRLAYVAGFPGGAGNVALTDSGLFIQQTTGTWLKVGLRAPADPKARYADFLFSDDGRTVAVCSDGGIERLVVTGAALPSNLVGKAKRTSGQAAGPRGGPGGGQAGSQGVLSAGLAGLTSLLRREAASLRDRAGLSRYPERLRLRGLGDRKPAALAPLSERLGGGDLLVGTSIGAVVCDQAGVLWGASSGLPTGKDGAPVAVTRLTWRIDGGTVQVLAAVGPGGDGPGGAGPGGNGQAGDGQGGNSQGGDSQKAGIYRFAPDRLAWDRQCETGPAEGPVLLSLAEDGALVAAQTPVPATEWPGFALSATAADAEGDPAPGTDQAGGNAGNGVAPGAGAGISAGSGAQAVPLDLDTPTLALAPGGMAALHDPTAGRMVAGEVLEAQAMMVEGFGLKRRVVRAGLDLPPAQVTPRDLAAFGRRQSFAYVDSVELTPLGPDAGVMRPAGLGDTLALDGLITDLAGPAAPEPPPTVALLHAARRVPVRHVPLVPFAAASAPPSAAGSQPDGGAQSPAAAAAGARRLAISGRGARLLPAVLGGVFGLADLGPSRPSRGLPHLSIAALAQVMPTPPAPAQSTPAQSTMTQSALAQSAPAPTASGQATASAATPTGVATTQTGASLLAGTADGQLYRSSDDLTWQPDPAPAPPACAGLHTLLAVGGTLWCAGPGGIASRTNGAWVVAAAMPGGGKVTCLAVEPDGTVWAGTDNGLFASADRGVSWRNSASGALDPDASVTALLALQGGGLLAGLDGDGVLLRAASATTWRPFGGPIGRGRVSCLAAAADRVLAGTPDTGAFVADLRQAEAAAAQAAGPGASAAGAQGGGWQAVGLDPDLSVSAVCCTDNCDFAACEGALFCRDTTNGTGAGGSWRPLPIGLAGTLSCLLAPARPLAAAGATPVERMPFLLAGAAARLALGGDGDAGALRMEPVTTLPPDVARLLAACVLGPAARQTLVQAGLKIAKDAEVVPLPAGLGWSLGSVGAAGEPPLFLLPGAAGITVARPTSPPLRAAAARWDGNRLDLRVVPAAGAPAGPTADAPADNRLRLRAYPDELLFLPAAATDPLLTCVRAIAVSRPADDGSRTEVHLDAPPLLALDPASLAASANVVGASQGRTVLDEPLGDGNSDLAGQQFRLRQPPLTFLPGASPPERRSTLTITVDGVAWREAASFVGTGPHDHVYIVAIDATGNALITFGDGERGARVPTGIGNVRASYRSGMGNMPDALPLDQQPAGTTHLAYLMAGSGGLSKDARVVPRTAAVAPADANVARLTLPSRSRLRNRLVTPADYARLLAAVPGVAKVRTDSVALPAARPALLVTIAGEPAASSAGDPALLDRVRAILRASRAAGARPVQVQACDASVVRLAVRIWLAEGTDAAATVAAARAALLRQFGFAASRLAGDLVATDLLAAVQALRGVAGAEVSHLHRKTEAEANHPRIAALPARFAGGCRPAQLVYLVDDPGTLQVSVAPWSALVRS